MPVLMLIEKLIQSSLVSVPVYGMIIAGLVKHRLEVPILLRNGRRSRLNITIDACAVEEVSQNSS